MKWRSMFVVTGVYYENTSTIYFIQLYYLLFHQNVVKYLVDMDTSYVGNQIDLDVSIEGIYWKL